MLAGINVCVLQTKPCLRGLIFPLISGHAGLVNYLGTQIMFAGI